MKIETRLHDLGIKLPKPPKRYGNNVSGVVIRDLLFMSGCGPTRSDQSLITGKVGRDLSAEQAYQAARLTALNMLADAKAILGDLDKIIKAVKILGLVNAIPEFKEHPKVINGFSDLLLEIFGTAGVCARSAIGAGSLPFQIAVEVEIIFQIKTDQ